MSLEAIFSVLQSHSGLIINNAHKLFMESIIKERLESLGMSIDDYAEYVNANQEELKLLTDEAAINETYFFREEQQFDFLKEHFFPARLNERLSLWSAACSTGEEALSLYALARHCGLQADVYASDIDTGALAKLKAGVYVQNSLRVDGKKYAPLLNLLGTKEQDKLTVAEETLKAIKIFYYSLSSPELPPFPNESVDLIFIRNVFIYFSPQMRHNILAKLSKSLKTGGLLFLSVNEIASIDCTPDMLLEKEHTGTVYYLKKRAAVSSPAFSLLPKAETSRIASTQERISAPPPPQEVKKPQLSPPPRSKKDEGLETFYANFSAALEKHDVAQAEKILGDMYFPPHNMEFKYYFLGLLATEKQQGAEAADCFTKSTLLNKEFWPAWFQLGMIQRQEQNEKALQAFSSCAKAIESYVQNGKTCYNFLISQFSPEYFLLLCRNYTGRQG